MEKNIFGKRLKELRVKQGLSRRGLGEIFNGCNQTIDFGEGGSRESDLDNLLKIAKDFDVSVDSVFDEQW